MGEAIERFAEDPARWLRPAITAIYETFSAHRAATIAGADALATSLEVRELWSAVMEDFVQVTTAMIEAERARGAAPAGVPARDLAIALNSMNEQVLLSTLAGHAPAVRGRVLDVLWRRGWARSTALWGNSRVTFRTCTATRPRSSVSFMHASILIAKRTRGSHAKPREESGASHAFRSRPRPTRTGSWQLSKAGRSRLPTCVP